MNLLETLPIFDSAQDAFLAAIRSLLAQDRWVEPTTDPTSVGSCFGERPRRTKELVCAGFALSNARSRLIDCPPRHIDLPFAFANFIWAIRGDNDVASITYYNPKGAVFSDDGKHYAGALGYRMQRTPSGSQLNAVIEILRQDPSSRRAVILFYANMDSIVRPRDTPCIVSMQLLIREGKLLSIVNMRSQSALMVMPYDLVLFTMLHELIAAELDIEPGAYFHVCGSLHLYEDEMGMATDVIELADRAITPGPMQAMPLFPMRIVGHVCELEEQLRTHERPGALSNGSDSIPAFWSDIMKVLVAGIARKNGCLTHLEPGSIPQNFQRWFLTP